MPKENLWYYAVIPQMLILICVNNVDIQLEYKYRQFNLDLAVGLILARMLTDVAVQQGMCRLRQLVRMIAGYWGKKTKNWRIAKDLKHNYLKPKCDSIGFLDVPIDACTVQCTEVIIHSFYRLKILIVSAGVAVGWPTGSCTPGLCKKWAECPGPPVPELYCSPMTPRPCRRSATIWL